MKERLKEIFGDSVRFIRDYSTMYVIRLRGCYPQEQIEDMVKEFEGFATSYTYWNYNKEEIYESYFYYAPTNYTQFCLYESKSFNDKKKEIPTCHIDTSEAYRIVGMLNPIVNGKKLYKRILIQRTRNYWGEICNMKYLTYKIE